MDLITHKVNIQSKQKCEHEMSSTNIFYAKYLDMIMVNVHGSILAARNLHRPISRKLIMA